MKIVKNATLKNKEVQRLADRAVAPTAEIETLVRSIIADIHQNGNSAAVKYAQKFDGLKTKNIKASAAELKKAADSLAPKVKKAINASITKVRDFHKHQVEKSWEFTGKDGERLGQRIRPLKRVGVYVPGGAGAYPSTVIMNVVPALVAGVKEIVAVTPGNSVNPAVAYVLTKLGVTEVYKIGGAQAVAMLAHGTEKVGRVDKIVGPSNVYAAVAKKEVFGIVDIDMIAGPSEILVMADETADPDWVAADLLSQAEHGSGFEAAICVTTSLQQAKWISECVMQQVESSPKKEELLKVLETYCRIFVVKDWTVGTAIANALAPEHLEIITKNARKLSNDIENAGAIFIGPYSAEPVGDYIAGPNHVLPTNGTARFSSPLGVYDYMKRTSIIEYTQKAIEKNGKFVFDLATDEGFIHHAASVAKRMK